jgi:hypothetical protein
MKINLGVEGRGGDKGGGEGKINGSNLAVTVNN